MIELTTERGKKYFGKIISTNPLQCSFLKKNEKNYNCYTFPHIPDINDINLPEIIATLPEYIGVI